MNEVVEGVEGAERGEELAVIGTLEGERFPSDKIGGRIGGMEESMRGGGRGRGRGGSMRGGRINEGMIMRDREDGLSNKEKMDLMMNNVFKGNAPLVPTPMSSSLSDMGRIGRMVKRGLDEQGMSGGRRGGGAARE
ncbi:hypothetical protein PENTCL1PPCAC_3506 [Pristionchus entomophagus]|uniref:Uncharacterized protein n=1 Tax=Pristionchus entomophagus TaxID=358040 RepID=A0AAV5SDB5_9BILA|nr:hypothetical protein PENTCL1PPCAC_3506 [Pristionchus entomophagus]